MVGAPRLEQLGRAAAEAGDAHVRARSRPPLDERMRALDEERARRRAGATSRELRGPVAIGLALGAAAAAVLLWPASTAAPLTFAVGEPTVAGETGAWLVAPAARELPVGFSDGTRVKLAGGARVRVLDLTAHGARVAIERGSLRADVVPRSGNDWSVVGGPFEIHVTGTSFDAGWDPDAEVLRVTMHEGKVVVRAPCLPAERPLVAGESAALSCRAAKPDASAAALASRPSADAAGSSRSSPSQTTFAAPGGPPPAPSGAAGASADPAASAAEPPASFRDLSRRGDYKGALAAAEAEGFGALVERLSAAELLELGTTARLAGRSARAVEAYAGVRRRFGGSDAAATAAFHLGQLAFDGAHAYGEALRWFSAYLTDKPGGPLAGEALGRSMEAQHRLGDANAAKETARRYLARFPGGAHAALAESLIAP